MINETKVIAESLVSSQDEVIRKAISKFIGSEDWGDISDRLTCQISSYGVTYSMDGKEIIIFSRLVPEIHGTHISWSQEYKFL